MAVTEDRVKTRSLRRLGNALEAPRPVWPHLTHSFNRYLLSSAIYQMVGDTGIRRNGPCRQEYCKLVGAHNNPLEYNRSDDKVKNTA